MASKLGKIVADFTTSLAASVSVAATTASLQSATDDDGNALPAGTYYFAIDADNANKEYIKATLSGTSLSSISSVSRQGVESAGFARAHRVGASAVLTDFAQLKLVTDLLSGSTDLDASNPLKYDGTATINNNNMLATKAYADALAIAGAPDASTTQKGLIEEATQAEVDAGTAAGSAGRLAVNPSTIRAKNYHDYAADAGASDTYAITVTPAPTAYAAGQIFTFKANTANTGAATLNVNSLGAKTIKKDVSSDLATGDILANQIVQVVYDGTNMQLLSRISIDTPAPTVRVYTSSDTWSKPSGLSFITVELVGGGGGGAGSGASNAGAAGGGGGGYSKKTIPAASLGSTETVTVGAAGSAGTSGNNGGTGGTTSLGSHCSATGGAGGTWNGAGAGVGGAGGIGSDGDINIRGGGGDGQTNAASSSSGSGGNSMLGGGGAGSDTTGKTGGAYGGGGSGGWNSSAGGAGFAGVVIVTEYF